MSNLLWKVVSDGDKYNVKTSQGLKFKEPISKEKAESIVDAWEHKFRSNEFKIVHLGESLYNVQYGKKMLLSKPQDLKTVHTTMRNIDKIKKELAKLNKIRMKELEDEEEKQEKYWEQKVKEAKKNKIDVGDIERKTIEVTETVEEAIRRRQEKDLADLLEYKRMK